RAVERSCLEVSNGARDELEERRELISEEHQGDDAHDRDDDEDQAVLDEALALLAGKAAMARGRVAPSRSGTNSSGPVERRVRTSSD
ncbi:MAG TPA: hypothetical protein VF361_07680, partial [Candidatus Limnocylindrales bacterium]